MLSRTLFAGNEISQKARGFSFSGCPRVPAAEIDRRVKFYPPWRKKEKNSQKN
jgi:hypothetical protein